MQSPTSQYGFGSLLGASEVLGTPEKRTRYIKKSRNTSDTELFDSFKLSSANPKGGSKLSA